MGLLCKIPLFFLPIATENALQGAEKVRVARAGDAGGGRGESGQCGCSILSARSESARVPPAAPPSVFPLPPGPRAPSVRGRSPHRARAASPPPPPSLSPPPPALQRAAYEASRALSGGVGL